LIVIIKLKTNMEALYDSELEELEAMDVDDEGSCDSSDEEREPM
jgi:hypothetical protein